MSESFVYPSALSDAIDGFHSHDLTVGEMNAIQEACIAGDVPRLELALSIRGEDYWTGAKGRKVLRLVACLACVCGHKSCVFYLVLQRNVSFNLVPEDELALDVSDPNQQLYKMNSTPLLTSILSHREDFALFVLSLRPKEDLDLGRMVGTINSNTLHRAAEQRMSRVLEILLRRPEAPPFGRDEGGQSFTCIAASHCNVNLLRVCLEAHRAHGTLHVALESPCQTANGRGSFNCKPLLEHVIMTDKKGVTPETREATRQGFW